MKNITVGEVIASGEEPYHYVDPSLFSTRTPNTYTSRAVGPTMRIDWSFQPTSNATRTFQLAFDGFGVLRTYPTAAHPYEELSWIAVGKELTDNAPVNEATLTVVLRNRSIPARPSSRAPAAICRRITPRTARPGPGTPVGWVAATR